MLKEQPDQRKRKKKIRNFSSITERAEFLSSSSRGETVFLSGAAN
jgi:hypothetical protein